MKLKLSLLAVSMLMITACSHSPSAGDQMLTHSNEAKKLGEKWTKGESYILESTILEKKGNKLISSGNKKISQGKKLISKGESEANKGSKMIEVSHEKLRDGIKLKQESEYQFVEKYPEKLK